MTIEAQLSNQRIFCTKIGQVKDRDRQNNNSKLHKARLFDLSVSPEQTPLFWSTNKYRQGYIFISQH